MKMKSYRLFSVVVLLSGATLISSFIKPGPQKKKEKKVINITGTRFFYPLVEKWASVYKKDHPDVEIVVKFGLQNADISMTGTPVDKENPEKGKYTVVSRFAIVPIVNEKNPKYNYPVGARTRLLPAIQFFSHSMFETGFLKRAGLE